jgi:hypothetical protein
MEANDYISKLGELHNQQYRKEGYTPVQYGDNEGPMYGSKGGYSPEYQKYMEDKGITRMHGGTADNPRQGHFFEQRSELDRTSNDVNQDMKNDMKQVYTGLFDRPFYDKKTGQQSDPTPLMLYYKDQLTDMGFYDEDPQVVSEAKMSAYKTGSKDTLDEFMRQYIEKSFSITPITVEDTLIDEFNQ